MVWTNPVPTFFLLDDDHNIWRYELLFHHAVMFLDGYTPTDQWDGPQRGLIGSTTQEKNNVVCGRPSGENGNTGPFFFHSSWSLLATTTQHRFSPIFFLQWLHWTLMNLEPLFWKGLRVLLIFFQRGLCVWRVDRKTNTIFEKQQKDKKLLFKK